jgi:hypothetical protein
MDGGGSADGAGRVPAPLGERGAEAEREVVAPGCAGLDARLDSGRDGLVTREEDGEPPAPSSAMAPTMTAAAISITMASSHPARRLTGAA